MEPITVKTKIILLLAAPLVALICLKLYLHLQVKAAATQVARQMSPVADISFGQANAGLDGTLSVSNIQIRPRGNSDPLHIRSLSIELPSFWYALNLSRRLERGELPESLVLRADGVRLNANGQLVQRFDDLAYASDTRAMTAIYQADCPSRVSMLLSQQYLLGFDDIRLDGHIGYVFDKDAQVISALAGIRQHGAMAINLALSFELAGLDPLSLMQMLERQVVHSASLELVDEGYVRRLLHYCSRIDDTNPDDILDDLLDRYLALFDTTPMNPTAAMVDDFRRFIVRSLNDDSTRIQFHVRPTEPRNLAYLSLYNRNDVPLLLNLSTELD